MNELLISVDELYLLTNKHTWCFTPTGQHDLSSNI